MKFKLLKGVFADTRTSKTNPGHQYNAKDPKNCIVESDKDLAAMFVNKFQKLPDEEPKEVEEETPDGVRMAPARKASPKKRSPVDEAAEAVGAAAANKKAKKISKQAEEDGEEVVLRFGEDVTTRYPKASDADLKVFQIGDEFTVTDAGDPTTALNPKPLQAKDVEKFISKYLKE